MFKKFLSLTKLPFWLKSGLLIGFFLATLIMLLPGRLTNLAYLPWYLGWLVLPASIIFGVLCIIFRIDFVSNFQPGEGPLRQILLPVFWFISLFAISFAIGVILGLVINIILKKLTRKKSVE